MRASLAANLLYFPATQLGGQPVRRLLKEYRGNDLLSRNRLEEMQVERLRALIQSACKNIEFYRKLEARRDGPQSSCALLDGWPILEKDQIRTLPDSIRNMQVSAVERKTTSGSTGHPVTVHKNVDALARERAATLRAYGWAGIEPASPQALLWGVPHTTSGRVRARVLDTLANRLRLNVFGVTEARLAEFQMRIQKFRPYYLYGYVSAIKLFLEYLEQTGSGLPQSVKRIVTTAELLDQSTRALLSRLAGVPVFNEYGCGEVGSIAHDCEYGRLHVMSDNLILECLPSPNLPDGLGDLVVTDLFNSAMPLIRYRLGDLGALSPANCDCGRPYPILDRVVGRAYDLVEDGEGRLYHPEAILYVFEDLRRAGIALPPYQAVQQTPGSLTVRIQTNTPITSAIESAIRHHLQGAVSGSLKVAIECVASLEREPSGKLRVVKRVR